MEKQLKRGNRAKLVLSVLLIMLGVLFAVGNLGMIPYNFNKIILSWQMLVIIIGIITMLNRHLFHGLFLTSIGAFFIFPRLAIVFPETFGWAAENFASIYWPFLLIFLGVLLLLHWLIKPKNHCSKHIHTNNYKKKKQYQINEDFSKNAVFGNGEHIILDPEFRGGELNAVFGGITLDLRKTNLPEGETVLEINAVFGGIVIYVPETWMVEIELDSIFGGFSDDRAMDDHVDSSRKLIIRGSCVFGGGELKN